MSDTLPSPQSGDDESDAGANGNAGRIGRSAAQRRPSAARARGPLGVSVRAWSRNTFTGEQFMSALRTLLWVAPLTILIWIYAEREQVLKPEPVVIPVELVSSDPNRIVTLREPSRPEVMAMVSGSKVNVDHVTDRLKPGIGGPLRVDVPAGVGIGEQRIPARSIRDNALFVSHGVDVSSIQPEWLRVFVDQVVERDVPVRAPDGFSTLRPPVFDPATIHIRAPETLVRDAESRGALIAVADLSGRPELLSAESKVTLPNVKVTLPFASSSEHVTIVGPSTVSATVEPARLEEYTIDYVSVMVTAPQEVLEDFKVTINPPTIPSVRVTGPKEEIEQLKRPPKPKATFELPPDAPQGTAQAVLHFDLPPHVKLVDPVPKTVEYTLVKREKTP